MNLKITNLVRFGFRNEKIFISKEFKKRSVGFFQNNFKFFQKTLHYGFEFVEQFSKNIFDFNFC